MPEVQMNTNGSRMDWRLSWKLINSGLDRIIFSCDSVDPERYNRIRKGGDFDTFAQNLKEFKYLRGEREKPIIRLNVAVMEENRGEIKDIKKFFKDFVDEFRFNTVYQQQGTQGEKRKIKKRDCPQIWQRLVIDVHGNVMPCCVDIKEMLKLGSVKTASLGKIWKGGRLEGIRNLHRKHYARQLVGCSACDNFALSELNEKNKVVWR
jgi:radical SAM protein with 4Fe4S-binding SPASM domain